MNPDREQIARIEAAWAALTDEQKRALEEVGATPLTMKLTSDYIASFIDPEEVRLTKTEASAKFLAHVTCAVDVFTSLNGVGIASGDEETCAKAYSELTSLIFTTCLEWRDSLNREGS